MLGKFILNTAKSLIKSSIIAFLLKILAENSYQKGMPTGKYHDLHETCRTGGKKEPESRMKHHKGLLIGILAIILTTAFFISLMVGNYKLDIFEILNVIWLKLTGNSEESIAVRIIWKSRLPRLLLGMLTGAALAASGAVYQGCFRNPLVEPYILGVSSGAAFGAAVAIVLPTVAIYGIPVSTQISAMIFAFAAVGTAWLVTMSKNSTSVVGLVLAGIIIGSVFTSGIAILKYVATDSQLREITFWMIGGLYHAGWQDVYINFAVTGVSLICVIFMSWRLNILSAGDNEAKTLGVNPPVYRLIFIFFATVMSAAAVSTVGIIPWIGLMIPHAARMMFGPDNRWVIPAGAIAGASYLIICDIIARSLLPSEVPVGIITSLLGAPYLIYILRKKSREAFVD